MCLVWAQHHIDMEAFKDPNQEKISSFGKLVKFLSSVCLLPLSLNYNTNRVTFSYVSFKTLFFTLLISLPCILFIIWIFLQIEYYKEVANSFLGIYSSIDALAMILVPGNNFNPFVIILLISFPSKIWAAVPELSMDKSIKFPSNIKLLASMSLPLLLSAILYLFGNLLAVYSVMSHYTILEHFANIFLPFFVLRVLDVFYVLMTWTMLLAIIEHCISNISMPFKTEDSIRKSIYIYEKLQKSMNFIMFTMASFGYGI